jgi:hypothetical protein
MKWILTYTPRQGGSAHDQMKGLKSALEIFEKWEPDPAMNIIQFTQRMDGSMGVIIFESDDPTPALTDLVTYSPFFDLDLSPAIDPQDLVPHEMAAMERWGI